MRSKMVIFKKNIFSHKTLGQKFWIFKDYFIWEFRAYTRSNIVDFPKKISEGKLGKKSFFNKNQ